MTTVYRLLRLRFAANPFDGEGAYRFGGRWSSPGTRVVYTSRHQSLAMLEYFVHLDADDPPIDLVLATAQVPREVSRKQINPDALPLDWRASRAPSQLANIGDDFVARGKNAILIVPSALSPSEQNWILNPQHPDFTKIRLQPLKPFQFDQRLFHRANPTPNP